MSLIPSQHFNEGNKETITVSTVTYMESRHMLTVCVCHDAPGNGRRGTMRVHMDRKHKLEPIGGTMHEGILHSKVAHSTWLGDQLLIATSGNEARIFFSTSLRKVTKPTSSTDPKMALDWSESNPLSIIPEVNMASRIIRARTHM